MATKQLWRGPGMLNRARSEARQLVRLALPLIISQIAYVLLGLLDTLMAAPSGAVALAAVSMGSSIWIAVFLSLFGVCSAVGPFVAQYHGANAPDKIRHVTQQAVWLTLGLSALAVLLLLNMRPLLEATGAPAAVIAQAHLFLQGIAIGTPAGLLGRTLGLYASSTSNARPGMFFALGAVVLNIPLNWLLINGHWGLPALGGAGCGWASGISMWLLLPLQLWHLKHSPRYQGFRALQHFSRPHWPTLAQLLRFGLPIGLTFLGEVGAFSSVALFISRLGEVTTAAHQIVTSLSTLTYMLPQGLSIALSIRVAQALGAQQAQDARFRWQVGLLLALLVACGSASLMWLATPARLAYLYHVDLPVLHIASVLLGVAAWYQLSDAIQVCAAAALRAYKISTLPMLAMLVAFWCIAMPVGYLLAYRPDLLPGLTLPPLGALGFWLALLLGLTLAAGMLLWALLRVSRQACLHSPPLQPAASTH